MSYPRLTKCMPDETRHNPFRRLHKALRFGHCRMLAELGTQDFGDDVAAGQLLVSLGRQLALYRTVAAARHPAQAHGLDANRLAPSPGSCQDHASHLAALAELESLVRAVTVAAPQRRRPAALSIYRCYALYSAADLRRMDEEETTLLALLHRSLADEALRTLEIRTFTSLGRDDLQALLQLLMPAISAPEAEDLLALLLAGMEPAQYATSVEPVVRPHLAACSSAAA